MKRYYIFLILIFIISCTNLQDKIITDGCITISLSNEKIERYFADSTILKTVRMVKLETVEKSMLSSIERICEHNDTLFVFDESLSKIIIFAPNGKYLSSIQKIGRGPLEYNSVIDFCIDTVNRHIILLCDRPYKFMRFDYNGNPISEKPINEFFLNIAAFNEMIYCVRPNSSVTDNYKYEIALFGTDFNIKDDALRLRDDITNNLFNTGNHLSLSGNVYYTRRFDDAIYQIKGDQVFKKYHIDFKRHTMPSGLPKEHDASGLSQICRENEYIFSITNVVESNRYLLFCTNIGIYVFDKERQNLEGYKTIDHTKMMMSTSEFLPVNYSDNRIASIIRPQNLSSLKELAAHVPDIDKYEQLKFVSEMEEGDNPILLIYELI